MTQRAWCEHCGERWPIKDHQTWGQRATCRSCGHRGRLEPEPPDEKWWAWAKDSIPDSVIANVAGKEEE